VCSPEEVDASQSDRGARLGQLYTRHCFTEREDGGNSTDHHLDGPAQRNGMRVLEEKTLRFDLPHRVSGTDANLDVAADALAAKQ